MMPKRPFLCRLGFHRWRRTGSVSLRCTRSGCHRSKIEFYDGSDYEFDQILCSCGVVIVPARGDGMFWRNVNTGEVCYENHWHEPAR